MEFHRRPVIRKRLIEFAESMHELWDEYDYFCKMCLSFSEELLNDSFFNQLVFWTDKLWVRAISDRTVCRDRTVEWLFAVAWLVRENSLRSDSDSSEEALELPETTSLADLHSATFDKRTWKISNNSPLNRIQWSRFQTRITKMDCGAFWQNDIFRQSLQVWRFFKKKYQSYDHCCVFNVIRLNRIWW